MYKYITMVLKQARKTGNTKVGKKRYKYKGRQIDAH